MIEFILGVIIGILIREIKCDLSKEAMKAKLLFGNKKDNEVAQFIEPESQEERLKKSEDLADFLE